MSNVLINGRSAVHKDSGGKLMTVDVCLTKIGSSVVPIPYANIAQSSDASKTASSVKINGQPVCTKDSVFSKSKGDEPGNKKGVKSGTKGGEASFIMGSTNVTIEGACAVRALDSMVSNKQNTAPIPLMQNLGVPPLPIPAQSVQPLEGSEKAETIVPALRVQQPYLISELPVLNLPDGNRQFPFQYDGDAWCFIDPEFDHVEIEQIPVLYACQQGQHVETLIFATTKDTQRPGDKTLYLVTQGNWPDGTQVTVYIQQWDQNTFVDRTDIPLLINNDVNLEYMYWYAPTTLNPFDIYRLRLEHPIAGDIYSVDTLYIEKKLHR